MITAQEKAYHTNQRRYFDTIQAYKSKGIEPSLLEMQKSENGRAALKALREARRITNGCAAKMREISKTERDTILANFRAGKFAAIVTCLRVIACSSKKVSKWHLA